MKEYHKIQSLYKRDPDTHKFIEGEYSLPEFEFLKDVTWVGTEKVDGTNIRVIWDPVCMIPTDPEPGWDKTYTCGPKLDFGGRTDKASIPTFLLAKLQGLFPQDLFQEVFPETEVCLYGEGYGARIQKGGGNYISDGVDFILFDVKIGDWWLTRERVEFIAEELGIKIVPVVFRGPLEYAVEMVKGGFNSTFSSGCNVFDAEGLVLKPQVDLFARNGDRIVTKIKGKDFA